MRTAKKNRKILCIAFAILFAFAVVFGFVLSNPVWKASAEETNKVDIFTYDISDIEYKNGQAYNTTDGSTIYWSGYCKIETYIFILPEKDYSILFNGEGYYTTMIFYDIYEQFISGTSISSLNSGQFTTPKNCYYIRFAFQVLYENLNTINLYYQNEKINIKEIYDLGNQFSTNIKYGILSNATIQANFSSGATSMDIEGWSTGIQQPEYTNDGITFNALYNNYHIGGASKREANNVIITINLNQTIVYEEGKNRIYLANPKYQVTLITAYFIMDDFTKYREASILQDTNGSYYLAMPSDPLETYNKIQLTMSLMERIATEEGSTTEITGNSMKYLSIKINPNSYDLGYEQGSKAGYNVGYNSGYTKGYSEGAEGANSYTFLGLMTAVVDAPVKAFTGLLDFNILGFNVASVILGLLSVALLLKIIQVFTRGG